MDVWCRRSVSIFVLLWTIMLFAAACAAVNAGEPRNVERQTREFRISVDGKPRGTCKMEIHRRDDGSDLLRIDSALRLNFIVYNYRYSSTGTELWKDGRLIALQNQADFNGDTYHVKAHASAEGLSVVTDGRSTLAPPRIWTTSYWMLPSDLAQTPPVNETAPGAAPRSAPCDVTLLDSDKGRILHGRLERVGQETLNVTGQRIPCTHYRLGGDVEVNLWYDDAARLVRQETVESGHNTLLELTLIGPR